MHRLILFTRTGCHLCTDMARALEPLKTRLQFSLELKDVDSAPELDARWGELVPVLATAAGTEICHYHLDMAALRQALGPTPPQVESDHDR
ncbi:MAG TPA: glutaredoxin family protein [Acidiferrobacteraceae bacterium]|nr:glutaredoxin family protein [Acidiferrobacteraceae bacterium]